MLKKTINSTTYFISAILFLIGSFLCIFHTGFTVNMILYLLCLGILLDAVLQCIQEAGMDGGYIISSDHSIHDLIPLENVHCLVDTVKKHGVYPIKL